MDCTILDDYVKSKNGSATYSDCLFYLNNNSNLTQIQIFTCLSKYFPRNSLTTCDDWIGVV